MNCHESQDWLQRRLDGEALIPSPELKRHLAECRSCHALHASGRALLKGVKAMPAAMPPTDLARRLTALALEDRRVRRRRVRVRLLVTAALAASILIMALVGPFLPPLPRSATSKDMARENNKDIS